MTAHDTRAPAPPPAPTPELHPVDTVIALYQAALVPVWLGLASKIPAAPWIALAHAVAALLPAALRRVRTLPAAAQVALTLYPAVALAVFWAELGLVQALRSAPPLDPLVRRLDLALFGSHWHVAWMDAMPQAWMSELMHFGYFLYYLVLAIPPFAILLTRGRDVFRSATLAVMVTYLSCFLFYLAAPVHGPRALAGAEGAPVPGGLFHTLVERARESGDSLGTAFPSSHVAGVVTIAWVAWRWLPRGWAVVLSVAAAMVTLSTIYTRNHYAVDALAGILWAVPLQAWLVPRLERRAAARPRAAPLAGEPPRRAPSGVSSSASP